MARQPVKITYARKRVHGKSTAKLTSSPLEVLSPHRDDITRSEMSRRMLKRSRRISHEDDDKIRINVPAVKRARRILQASEPDSLPVGADINVFQTPFPSTEYIHASSLTRPFSPEHISPVPHAKQIFSRISSQNLKENNTLASPFHSSHKSKPLLYHLPLHSKSRTLPGAWQKDNGPDSQLFIRPNPTGNLATSPFLGHPRFFSTPQQHLFGSRTGPQASASPSRLAFHTYSPRDARDADFEMTHCAEFQRIPKIHIASNSIMSSSGSFTLGTRLISNVPGVANDHNTNVSIGSAPMSISNDVLPGPQKISMGNYMAPLASSPFPAFDVVNSGSHCRNSMSLGQNVMPLSGTSLLVSPAPADDPTHTATSEQRLAFPTSSHTPCSLVCPAIKVGEYIRKTRSPLSLIHHGGASTSSVCAASQTDLIQDMLALDLGGGNHDAGVQDTQLPMRTRSLDNPPGISSKKASTAKHKRNRAGTIRASDFVRPAISGTSGPLLTSHASTTVEPTNSLPGRTRSGTVVGPNSRLAVQSRSNGIVKRQPAVQLTQPDAGGGSVDELAALKVHECLGPRSTENLKYVGSAHRGKNKKGKCRKGKEKEKVMHDDITSDDPLLIIGPWKDEDWS